MTQVTTISSSGCSLFFIKIFGFRNFQGFGGLFSRKVLNLLLVQKKEDILTSWSHALD